MTLFINDRAVVHRRSGGILKTISVNFTGEARVPVPYNNIALSKHAINLCTQLTCNGEALCHANSTFAKSTGDEAGTYGGIHTGTVAGPARFVSNTAQVFVNGLPLATIGDLMVSNSGNTEPAPLQSDA